MRNAFMLSNGDLCIVTTEFMIHDMKSHKARETEGMDGF